MDKTIISEEEAVEEKVPESETSGKVQPDDVEMEETKTDSPSTIDEPGEAEEELAERPLSDSVPESGDNLCTVCGFSAKCPRSLKIHYARKHGKNSKNTVKTATAEQIENISDVSLAEIQQEVDMEESDLLEVRSASDNSKNTKSLIKKQSVLHKQQMDREEMLHTRERRVSKRTPKPKMIYSCNYCGQEFRDKAPLDVHVQRYHAKDTPYTREYMIISGSVKVKIQIHTEFM